MSAPKSNLEALPRSIQFVLLLGFVALAAFPFVGSEFYQQMVARMMILAIFAMSLDLLQGVTGLVSLGHAAFFGLGGYALALMSSDNGPVSLWWTLPAAVLVAGLFALVIGFFVVRTRGIYFIMVTMAFAQMLFYLVFDNKELNFLGLLPLRLGGSDGVYINFKPDAALFDLENKKVFYYFVLACLVLVYVFLRRLRRLGIGLPIRRKCPRQKPHHPHPTGSSNCSHAAHPMRPLPSPQFFSQKTLHPRLTFAFRP